jgi:hypothetical protein
MMNTIGNHAVSRWCTMGILPLSLVVYTLGTSAAGAACDCSSSANCSAGFFCKPVPKGCGGGIYTGWCTSSSTGGGFEPLDLPAAASTGPESGKSGRGLKDRSSPGQPRR